MNDADMFVPELQAKLDLLETRIRQILDHTAGLKRQNIQLTQEMNDLKAQLEISRLKCGQLENAIAEVEQWKAEVRDLKISRDHVTDTIESLLILIEELQTDLTGETQNQE